MIDDFVEKYSSLLNGQDIIELFNRLKELTNRTEASRNCDLERRTTYYWTENRAIRLLTKQKVLRAILETDFEFAVKYLLSRVYFASKDMLEQYLGFIYENSMAQEIEISRFKVLIEEFRQIRIQYSAMINQRSNARIYQMFTNLQKKAVAKGIILEPLPMSTMNIEDARVLIPSLMKRLPPFIDDNTMTDYGKRFNFSKDLLNFVMELQAIPKKTVPLIVGGVGNTVPSEFWKKHKDSGNFVRKKIVGFVGKQKPSGSQGLSANIQMRRN